MLKLCIDNKGEFVEEENSFLLFCLFYFCCMVVCMPILYCAFRVLLCFFFFLALSSFFFFFFFFFFRLVRRCIIFSIGQINFFFSPISLIYILHSEPSSSLFCRRFAFCACEKKIIFFFFCLSSSSSSVFHSASPCVFDNFFHLFKMKLSICISGDGRAKDD
jgi:hypothetical protein